MQLKDLAKASDAAKQLLSIFKEIPILNTLDDINKLRSITSSYSKEILIAAISQGVFSQEQIKAILQAKGLTEAEIEEIIATNALSASQVGTATTTLGLGTAFKGLRIAISNTTKAICTFLASNPVGWILGIIAAIGATTLTAIKYSDSINKKIQDVKKSADELKNSLSSFFNETQSNLTKISSLSDRFNELSKNVDDHGIQIDGTKEEYEEYLDICQQVKNIMPDLVTGYTSEGKAIVSLRDGVESLTDSYKEAIRTKAALFISKGDENGNTIESFFDDYNNFTRGKWGVWDTDLFASADKLERLYGYDYIHNILSNVSDASFEDLSNIDYWQEEYDYLKALLSEAGYDISNITIDNYNAIHDIINTKLTIMENEMEEKVSNIRSAFQTYLYSDNDYWNIDDENAISAIDSFYSSIDDEFIRQNNLFDPASLQTFESNFVSLFNNDVTKQPMIDLYTPIGEDESINAYTDRIKNAIDIIRAYCDDNNIEVPISFADTDDIIIDYQNILNDAAKRISGTSDGEIINERGNYMKYHEIYAALDEFANEYSINTQDELAYLQDALKEAEYDIDKAFELYLSKMQDDLNGDVNSISISTVSDSVSQMAQQLKPQFGELASVYSSIFAENGMDLKIVDNDMLESLRKSFAEIEEDLGVTFDASQLNGFFNVLTDGTSTVNEVHDAFNDLATAYFYSTDTLEHLNEATAESIKQQLEQMGVVNSEEIIDHYLQLAEAENGLLELQDQLAEAKKDLAESSNRGEYENARAKIDLIYEQIEAYYNEKGATEDLRIALFNLQLQQAGLSIESINSSASVSELLRLASAAGLSAEYMDKLVLLQELINRYHSTTNGYMRSAIEAEIRSVESSLQKDLDNSQLELKFDFPSGKDSGAGSAGKDAAEEYLEGFNNELERLKFLQDNRIITEKEYLDQLRILYEKYFKDKKEYLEEYIKYEHEYLNGLKSLYEDVLGGITDLLDQQIDKTEEERDAKIDALEEEQEARTKVLEQQKEQLDLQIEEIEAQIKGKNDAIDAINDEIDAIRKANDERQRQIDLQKALYDLERMQNQRTILQYSEDKGMHYVSDTSGIRDAKDAVDDAKREIEIANKEKQIALIEDEISLLETRKSLIEDQQADLDKQIDALDEYYKKLIENTEAYYSALIQPIENYKTQFESIADIESDASFDEQLKSLGYSVDDILALSSSTLENFKSNYLGILSDIYAGNSQMLDSLSMISGLDQDEFVGYLSQSQPFIDSLARLDLSSTQLAIDSANSGIYSFADGAVLATTNMTTMADTVTSLLEGDKKQAGIISSFETMTSVLADANTQIAGIASGMEELDGKTATIRINIETNGDTSLLGMAHVSGTAITGASHVEGTALASGNWAVQSNEKNALVGEVGRELIVRGGRFFTVGNYGAEMFNIKKGDIVFNHEQTEALLKNGHISGRGKAYADGTVGGGRFLTADGRILRPLQESDKGFELLQKFQPLVDRIIKGEEGLITNAVFDSQKQFEQMLKSVMNNTAINNISNNRNSQPVVHQQFNITMPNVTNSTSAEILMNDLQSLSTKKFQMEW